MDASGFSTFTQSNTKQHRKTNRPPPHAATQMGLTHIKRKKPDTQDHILYDRKFKERPREPAVHKV